MREKLNTLPLSELKELAKAQKLKGFSSLRKAAGKAVRKTARKFIRSGSCKKQF